MTQFFYVFLHALPELWKSLDPHHVQLVTLTLIFEWWSQLSMGYLTDDKMFDQDGEMYFFKQVGQDKT